MIYDFFLKCLTHIAKNMTANANTPLRLKKFTILFFGYGKEATNVNRCHCVQVIQQLFTCACFSVDEYMEFVFLGQCQTRKAVFI